MPYIKMHAIAPGLLGACIALSSPASLAATPDSTTPPPVEGGIWKAAVPPRPMHGEFDNYDPMGLAAGAKILADCSLNWTSPDTGKLYCFVSGTSLVYFLERPGLNARNAEAAWMHLGPEGEH